MIKNPIQAVTSKLQYRAIGIVNGSYKPHDLELLNKGVIIDSDGISLDAVILGKSLSLIKKYIDLEKQYFWIVYPRNKNVNNIHLQIAGIWDPYNLNEGLKSDFKKNPTELLEELNLKDNYFSIRGELIYVNKLKKEIIIKIVSSKSSKKPNNNLFKIILKGEIPIEFIHSFLSLDVMRVGNTLKMHHFEVVDKEYSKTI